MYINPHKYLSPCTFIVQLLNQRENNFNYRNDFHKSYIQIKYQKYIYEQNQKYIR